MIKPMREHASEPATEAEKFELTLHFLHDSRERLKNKMTVSLVAIGNWERGSVKIYFGNPDAEDAQGDHIRIAEQALKQQMEDKASVAGGAAVIFENGKIYIVNGSSGLKSQNLPYKLAPRVLERVITALQEIDIEVEETISKL